MKTELNRYGNAVSNTISASSYLHELQQVNAGKF